MMMTAAVLLVTALAAGLVQSMTGFDAAVVLMLVLPLFFSMPVAAGISNSICLGLTAILAWQYRKHVLWRLILLPSVCYLAASTVAIQYVQQLPTGLLTILFGAFLFLIAVYFFCASNRFSIRATPVSALICGTVGGACSGLFGTGGPPIVLYFIPAFDRKEDYLANTQFFFMTANAVNMITRCANGIYTPDLIPYSLAGICGVLLGKLIGLKLLNRIDTVMMKKCVYTFVALSGLLLIAKQVF